MPKLWSDTVLAHRESVRNATLDAVAALVAQNGLASLTMSDIAQTTGIGRAGPLGVGLHSAAEVDRRVALVGEAGRVGAL